MTPVEVGNWLFGAGLGVNVIVSGFTAIWVLARRSGNTDSHEKTQNEDIKRLNDELTVLTADLREVVEKAIRTDAGLKSHLDECGRHYADMTRAIDRLDKRIEAVLTLLGTPRAQRLRQISDDT